MGGRLMDTFDLKRAREMLPEILWEAKKRYPKDVDGALLFMVGALGLNLVEPTTEDIEWAQAALERIETQRSLRQ